MQRRVDRPCPPDFAGSPIYCYWCSEPLTWRRGRGWIHPNGKHHFEIWGRCGGLDFDHWAEPVKEEVMKELDEVKKLAEQAQEEIQEVRERFEIAIRLLDMIADSVDRQTVAFLKKALEAGLEAEEHVKRIELIQESITILRGGEPK